MLQTIVRNIEEKLKKSENFKIPWPLFGMLLHEEKELQDFYTNYAKEEGVATVAEAVHVQGVGTLTPALS